MTALVVIRKLQVRELQVRKLQARSILAECVAAQQPACEAKMERLRVLRLIDRFWDFRR